MATQSGNLDRLNVIVVEDNRNMANVIKQVPRSIGVRNMRLAFDGIEFARLVRTAHDSTDPYVPIIMLTGHTEHGRVKAAREAGVSEFLSKPISQLNPCERIVEVSNRRRPGHCRGRRRRQAQEQDGGPGRAQQ